MRFSKPNFFHQFLHKIYPIRPFSWIISEIAPLIDKFLMKKLGGKISLSQLLSGLPVVLLQCKGAKTGKTRFVPLVAVPTTDEGTDIALIASNWGKPANPSWYYNLKANPTVLVKHKGNKEQYYVEEVTDEAVYQNLWDRAVEYYSGYKNYKKRTSRQIPIMVLKNMN